MQTNIGLSGKTVVVGLNWSVIAKSGPGRKKDSRKACVDSGLTLGVVVDGPDLGAIGLCAKKAEYPSGAAMLAAANALAVKGRAFGDTTTNANWVLVEKLKEGGKTGMYWMCAISDGVPVPGTDVLEDLSVTSAKLAELVEILENVEIFSVEPEILEYVAGASPSFEKGFADLTANVSAGKSFRPQKLVGVPDWVYLLLIGITLAVLGVVGYSLWAEQQAVEMRRKAANEAKDSAEKKRQDDTARKTRSYQEADDLARKMELDRIRALLSSDPGSVMKAWFVAVNKLPINHGGWDVKDVSCDLAACKVSLIRDELLGTNASLRLVIPNAEFAESGGAYYSIPLTPALSRSAGLDSLASWNDFVLTVGSSLQELRMSGLVDAKLGERKDLMYHPPALPDAPDASPAKASQQAPKAIGLLSGPLSIRGTSLWQMDSAADYIASNAFAVESARVDFGRGVAMDPAWTVNGTFYVKSGGGLAVTDRAGGLAYNQGSELVPVGAVPMPPVNQRLPVVAAGSAK